MEFQLQAAAPGDAGGLGAKKYAYKASAANTVNMGTQSGNTSGGSQAHNNMAPYVALNYCISLRGVFPSRN
jgi:microcystin-dependent protein